MEQKNSPFPNGRQYERDLEEYRNESMRISESLLEALGGQSPSDALAAVRRFVSEFDIETLRRWTGKIRRAVGEFEFLRNLVENLFN